MLLSVSPQRRYVLLTVAFTFLLSVVFYSSRSVDTKRISGFVPGDGMVKSNPLAASTTTTQSPATKPQEPAQPTKSKPSNDDDADETNSEAPAIPSLPTSKFHYLIPASGSNRRLCFNLVSSAVNRYPVPSLMGWNGTGLLDAATTHLAKLHAIHRYLHRLPKTEDDDIALIVDGYDVIMQLPPDIMLKRYFKVLDAENARNAQRWNITVDDVWRKGLQTTLFFGPDKVCWPIDWRAPRCWAIPDSTLEPKSFGPKTNNGQMVFLIPKWLNSGTLMGPVKDLRAYVDATMYEILNTYNPKYEFKESDQYYLANVWGRQEYFRSKRMSKDGNIRGGPHDREAPTVYDQSIGVEHHVGIDYQSSMFQTKAGYEPFVDWMPYGDGDNSASGAPTTLMDKDMFNQGSRFKPFLIEMPGDVQRALSNLYDDIPDAHPGSTSEDFINSIVLGTNFITKNIWALWHVTGDKEVIEDQYTKFWFYPYARSLLQATVKKLQSDNRISAEPIGGRYWVHKNVYPHPDSLRDELGGAWSDEDGGKWINYQSLCQKWEEDALGGEVI